MRSPIRTLCSEPVQEPKAAGRRHFLHGDVHGGKPGTPPLEPRRIAEADDGDLFRDVNTARFKRNECPHGDRPSSRDDGGREWIAFQQPLYGL